ncbi:MAG: zinc-ribbon domain-containing protein [Candidatus Thorarchaeota archaeon]
MAKYCVYCGNPLKETDKFCIICGKPVLRDLSKSEKSSASKQTDTIETIKTPKERIKQKVPQKALSIEEQEEEISEEEIFVEKKEKKKKAKKEQEKYEKPLPFEVKEQMILYIEYNDIQLNKQILSDKLKDLQKELKDSQYEYNEEYNKSINVKLDAIKTLIDELKQKEADIDKKMEKPFIVQRIQNDIDTKIYQLKNLTKEFKLHKVDKESFEKLRDKYKQEKEDLETERIDLIEGMKLWIKELKLEKTELSAEKNLNKGRYSAKEISEEVYKEKNKDFELKLKKIDLKIETLEKLTK